MNKQEQEIFALYQVYASKEARALGKGIFKATAGFFKGMRKTRGLGLQKGLKKGFKDMKKGWAEGFKKQGLLNRIIKGRDPRARADALRARQAKIFREKGTIKKPLNFVQAPGKETLTGRHMQKGVGNFVRNHPKAALGTGMGVAAGTGALTAGAYVKNQAEQANPLNNIGKWLKENPMIAMGGTAALTMLLTTMMNRR